MTKTSANVENDYEYVIIQTKKASSIYRPQNGRADQKYGTTMENSLETQTAPGVKGGITT